VTTMGSPRSSAVIALSVAAVVAVGCAKAPPAGPAPMTIAAAPGAKTNASMTISVSADANPDRAGRPSPIVVRVYQLKTDAQFSAATFIDVFENEDKALGAERISGNEYVLSPKESRTIDIALSGETRFVGVIAAYRDILNSQWRAVVPTPKKGLTIAVERARLLVSPLN
jgi:type VI secretion system protein VasD